MLFMAHINDKDDTRVTTALDANGKKQLSRIFCTVAVTQYQVDPIKQKQATPVDGRYPETIYAMDQGVAVEGQGSYLFRLPLGIHILDALTVGYHIGAIPKTKFVDLREDNWDQIKNDYTQQAGDFSYLSTQQP